MKPNIFFIVIDGLRADKCFGTSKTSKTPNIDELIKSGTYFNQAVGSAPVTIPAISSILTGLYPFECMIQDKDLYVLNPKSITYIKNFVDYGYHPYATIPQSLSHVNLNRVFANEVEEYHYSSTLFRGNGENIIERLNSKKMKEPWFYYLHIYDLPVSTASVSVSFDISKEKTIELHDEKYGMNQYERIVSAMDVWLGKILEKIDLKNTLVILTADHGHEKGVHTKAMEQQTKSLQSMRKSWEKNPVYKTSHKLALKIPKSVIPFRKKLSTKYAERRKETIGNIMEPEFDKIQNQDLSVYEKRILKNAVRQIANVYDDRVRIPLIFSGYNTSSGKIINQQVRSIDIFPTIAEVIDLSLTNNDRRGVSLLPIMQGSDLDELPMFVESATNSSKSPNSNVIGIRTSNYKYFRDRNDSTLNVNLFDLKNDPLEENNIFETNKQVVEQMEKTLLEIQKEKDFRYKKSENTMDDDEAKKVENELRKLGYIN